MDDVTDTVFRQVIADCAKPDLYFTEFVNVDGLQSPGRAKLLHKLQFVAKEQPIFAQIWGLKPENFHKTASDLASMGFAGIDINMGCPVKTVIKDGACAALMNNRELASAIIKSTKKGAGKLPVSIKTRLGFSDFDPSWHEFLLGHNLAMLTIHGRNKKQVSKVPADWQAIGQIRELRDKLAPQTLIVGNGDVMSRAQGEQLADQHRLDGIMIGRGVFYDPFVFAKNSTWENYSKAQKLQLYKKHVELFAKTYQNNERRIVTLNKFCKIYVNGFDGAKELREQLMGAGSTNEISRILEAFNAD